MIGLLVLLFPVLLLGFMLFMARVEEPLNRSVDPSRDVEAFLDQASPQDLDAVVREGTDTAMRRFRNRSPFWRRRRGGR